LIVALEGIFYRLFGVFFFSLQLHLVYVCTERDTVRDPAPLSDRDIAALRADVARLCYRLPLSPMLVVLLTKERCWKYPLFRCLFPRLLLQFHALPILAFIAVQTAAATTLSQNRISRGDAF